MKQKVIAVILVLAMIFVFASGCTSGSNTPANTANNEAANQASNTNAGTNEANTAENTNTNTEPQTPADVPETADDELFYNPEITPADMPDVIYCAGSWHDMGVQFGAQTAEIVKMGYVTKYIQSVNAVGGKDKLYEQANKFLDELKARNNNLYELIVGIGEGAGLDTVQAALGTCLNLTNFEEACNNISAWGDATPDGKLIVGINGDGSWGNKYYFPAVVAYPEDGIAFMMPRGFFTNAGVNAAGVAAMTTFGYPMSPDDVSIGGTTMTTCIEVLSQCDDAVKAKEMYLNGGIAPNSGENFTCVDTKGNHFIIEHTAAHTFVREPGDNGETGDYLIATNGYFIEGMNYHPLFGEPDDNVTRYNTLEKFLRDEYGRITLDTLYRAESSTKYIIDGKWAAEDDLFTHTELAPENCGSYYKTHTRCILDVENMTMYRHVGGHNTINNLVPYTTGNLCKLTLGESLADTTFQARQAALVCLTAAETELNGKKAPEADKLDWLNKAKEQFSWGMNYTDLAAFAEDANQSVILNAKAANCFCLAQRYAQCAMDETEFFCSSTAVK